MKQIYLTAVCTAICFTSIAQEPAIATFEDLSANAESYWDGSDMAGKFISGAYAFVNNYTDWGGYGSWDGFAWSTMSSTEYASLDDQYNACTGTGVDGSQTFAVAYYSAFMGTEPTVMSADGQPFEAKGCYVTNSAYAYASMHDGDAYAKKFDETDWFKLTATGYADGVFMADADFYLAKDGNIVNDWQYFDLSALGTVDEIHFTLSSSDNGDWGMNTPAYFCLDNFGEAHNTVQLRSVDSRQNTARVDLLGRPITTNSGLVIERGAVRLNK